MSTTPDDVFADSPIPTFETVVVSTTPPITRDALQVSAADVAAVAFTSPPIAPPNNFIAQPPLPATNPVSAAPQVLAGPTTPVVAPPPAPAVPAAHATVGSQPVRQTPSRKTAAEHPLALLQKRWVQNAISLGTSLALHVVVIVLGLLTYKAAAQFVQKEEEQIIVPSSDMALDGTPGGSLHPGLGEDPNRDSGQDSVRDLAADHSGWADRPGDSLADVLVGGSSGKDTANNDIAMGLSGRGLGSLTGSGTGDSSGIGGAGQIAPWGPPGGGSGIGPKTSFLGSGGNALSVTYICDASGSMDTKFDLLKRKLEESIDRLQPIQQFNVLFFNDDKVIPLSSTFLLQAQAANKAKAYQFIDQMYVHASSDPLGAINAAFTQQPQLIYFLTDGEFPNDDAIVRKIASLNSRHTTKINTILLMGKSSEEKGMTTFVKVMRLIAADNGGTFTSLSVEDF